MGAESSSLSITEKELVEKLSHDVLLYDGKLNQANKKVSIFDDVGKSSEPFKNYLLERPLARSVRNLKIYRHPYSLLKFLASTDRMLVTELLQGSLKKILKGQNEIQICLGVKNILNALIFLVETAKVKHLNVCQESIFVTECGHWKLNGFEHVFTASDITEEFLKKSRVYRNQQAIDPNESDGTGLEQYAFASLCEAVISKESKIPGAADFLKYCQTQLKHKNPTMRPLLSAVLLHDFFNHDFILIHNFLSELPLKTQQSKVNFFKSLVEKLKTFDEDTIGTQLGDLLLSRLVLLEQSAQFYLLPTLLKPQTILEDDEETSSDEFIFSTPAFIQYMVPRLKKVFCVLDVQIRLILLEHFHLYVNTFTKEDLIEEILPQLLLGIKDTNDLLVTKTLLCLADLVSILGANLVIGKNRTKIFADGRPQQQSNDIWTNDQPRSITPVMNSSIDILSSSPIDHVDISDHSSKEVTVLAQNGDCDSTDDGEAGSEWNWEQEKLDEEIENSDIKMQEEVEISLQSLSFKEKPVVTTRPKIDDNIDDLDIKNKKLTKLQEQSEEDFFNDFDMTPTFKKSETQPQNAEIKSVDTSSSSRLQMSTDDVDDGWGDEDGNWNDDEL